MKVWIATLATFISYSQVASADPACEQVHVLVPIASYSDSPVLEASTHPSEVFEADRPTHQHSWDPGVTPLTQSPSVLTNVDENRKPGASYVPTNDFLQPEERPLLVYPDWVPTEGTFIGPGISFGIGFPIGFIGGFDWSETTR